MSCDIYYLDQFREAVADAKIAEEFAAINVGQSEAEDTTDQLPERLAKIMLDTAFIKIDLVTSLEARQRLLRYAVELCRNLRNDLDIELAWAAVIEEQLESKETD